MSVCHVCARSFAKKKSLHECLVCFKARNLSVIIKSLFLENLNDSPNMFHDLSQNLSIIIVHLLWGYIRWISFSWIYIYICNLYSCIYLCIVPFAIWHIEKAKNVTQHFNDNLKHLILDCQMLKQWDPDVTKIKQSLFLGNNTYKIYGRTYIYGRKFVCITSKSCSKD